MKHWRNILIGAVLSISFISCNDDMQMDEELIGIDEPIDNLVRLENIFTSSMPDGEPESSIDLSYDANQRLTAILFSGSINAVVEFTYAANNRLIQIDKSIANQSASSTLMYANNTITVTTDLPDGRRQQKELRIDSQNRIDRAISYDLNATGNRSETKRLQYLFTENFNVSRVNDLASNGSTVLSYTEFTYFFNNNPFRDMNDVIRYLVFEDFIPYTRYLPLTQKDYERAGGGFVESKSITYSYTLQEDDFPSSRAVETTTAAGVQTTYEFFNYQP
jgi:hypothetical protein